MKISQRQWIIAIVLLGAVLAGLIISSGTRNEEAAPSSREAHGPDKTEEGEVHLSEAQIGATGIRVEAAAAATLAATLSLPGEIRFNEDRTAHVVPRVDGVVEAVPAQLGQQVRKGQLLAVIASPAISELRAELASARQRRTLAQATFTREQKLWQERISAEQDFLAAQQALNEADIALNNARQKLLASGVDLQNAGALNRFELRAPFDGMIVEKHLSLGEAVQANAQAFLISDLSTVWATLSVPAQDLGRVRNGAQVKVRATAFDAESTGTVSFIGSLLGEQTRSATARVSLPNPQGLWRPGLFVTVSVNSGSKPVPVSVPNSALQTVEEQPVVFVRSAEGFRRQAVKTGLSDGQRTEITDGLKPGTPIATDNSFVLKAELGKAEAEHSH